MVEAPDAVARRARRGCSTGSPSSTTSPRRARCRRHSRRPGRHPRRRRARRRLGRPAARRRAPSAIEIQAAVDEAQQKADEAAARHERLHAQLAEARARPPSAQADVDAALAALHESDARLSAVAEQLAELGQQARSATAEADRLDEARACRRAGARPRPGRAVRARGAAAPGRGRSPTTPPSPTPPSATQLHGEVAGARQAEMEARLAVRTGEERVAGVAGRAEQLLRAAEVERPRAGAGKSARAARARGAVVAADVRDAAQQVLGHIGGVAGRGAGRARCRRSRTGSCREGELHGVRDAARELAEELAQLTDARAPRRDDARRAAAAHRAARGARRRGVRRRGRGAARRVRPGPAVPAAARSRSPSTSRPASAASRSSRRSPARSTGRPRRSAPPGPSATSPCSARSTRSRWRSSPRSRSATSSCPPSSRTSRRPAATCSPWSRRSTSGSSRCSPSAYADVAREFEIVFATLFPGGEGRLVLTDPDDMLLTGIDVEARPPGQEGQAAVAAVRRRALADRGGAAGRDLPGPAQPVLRPGRGRGGARRHQPRPAARR